MRFVGFIGPSYQLSSVNVDCQRCINLYPRLDELGTGKEKEVASLVGTPGLKTLVTIGTGPIRGIWAGNNGVLYAVSGTQLFSISNAWVATAIGTLNTSSGPVSMADNGLQLVIVDGEYGYYWDFTSLTFTQITDTAFPGANQVTYQDTFFIFNQPGTGQFFISGSNEVVPFDASQVASAEGSPDGLVALMSDHENLWLFGTQTIEVWYNAGASPFPFMRVSGAYIETGCAAAFSIAKMNNTVFWLGRDEHGAGIVYTASGYQPQRISTHAVEEAIQSYGDISDAVGYCYQENGHNFYVLNFTSANTTWVFDSATNMWHERAFHSGGQLQRHRANCHAFAYATHVVGDYQNGNLYQMASSLYSDFGTEIIRRRVAPHITDGLRRITYPSFQLDMETGVGLDGNPQGVNPQAMLRFSDDGGHKWSNEKWVSCGQIGQRKARALWRRLGMSRDRVFEITISDPVKVCLIGVEMAVESGGS